MIDQIVEKYIALREKRAELKRAYEAEDGQIKSAMDKVESYLLTEMQKQGVNAFKTTAGTAFSQERTSAGVADWDALLEHIKANDLWQMLERRVSKSAVDEFVAQHKDLPPGVNYRRETVVGIRRA